MRIKVIAHRQQDKCGNGTAGMRLGLKKRRNQTVEDPLTNAKTTEAYEKPNPACEAC